MKNLELYEVIKSADNKHCIASDIMKLNEFTQSSTG